MLYGQSVLSLARFKETAIKEALDRADQAAALIWLQEYSVNIDSLLDLSWEWDDMGPRTSAPIVAAVPYRLFERIVENRQSNWKPQHFVTRFIADCARESGYSGILYASTRDYRSDCLAIFSCELDTISTKRAPHSICS